MYPDFSLYNRQFEVDSAMIGAVKSLAAQEKVEWNEEQYQRSEKYIKLQIKALIARNVWEMQQYYEVTLTEDPTVRKYYSIY